MTMVEKVAKALYDEQASRSNILPAPWEIVKDAAPFWHDLARAAIEAMRDTPDVAYDNFRCDKLWREMNSREVFNLWIDAALKE